MIRNLKVLGLALVAVFAFSAMAASAASAQGILTTSNAAPVTLKATQTGAAVENSLTAFKQTIVCPNATYTGHKFNVTPHETLANKATQVTITPNYGTCEVLNTPFKVTVEMGTCDYAFDLKGTTGTANEYFVTTTVDNCGTTHIVMALFTNGEDTNPAKHFCDYTITQTQDYGEVLKAKDTLGTNGIDITGTVTGIVIHKVKNVLDKNSILCPTEEDKAGILHLDINVKDIAGVQNVNLSE